MKETTNLNELGFELELTSLTHLIIRDTNSVTERRYYTDSSMTGTFFYKKVKYLVPNLRFVAPCAHPSIANNPVVIPVNYTGSTLEYTAAEYNNVKPVEPIETKTEYNSDKVSHPQTAKITACIKHDIPVYLVGPAGTGKSYTLKTIAGDLGLDFYSTNAIQDVYTGLKGFIDAGGEYHETEFYKAFSNGGVFLIDEMDASIPEALTTINTAIANRFFEFPNGRIDAHPDFRIVAAGNTYGNGADELYTGRMVLDSASLDRFTVIKFDYDERVELHIAHGDKELVSFIRSIRLSCTQNGIRGTFSMRMIHNVYKLQQDLPLTDVLEMAVVKGMDIDTLNTIRPSADGGKYTAAYKQLLRA